MHLHIRLANAVLFFLFTISLHAQQPRDFAVRVTASVAETPAPSITLKWDAHKDQKVVYIHRKLKTASSFPEPPVATLDSAATMWTDTMVSIGVSYEYRLIRDIVQPAGTDSITGQPLYRRWWGFGYINSGMKVAPEPRGRVLVLVDTTLQGALASEISQYVDDVEAEGWTAIVRYVPRAETFNATAVTTVRSIITELTKGTTDTKAIFLVGRVPVPYSGLIAPDGHQDHGGAWPADGIYGDLNGTYTDATVNYPNTQRSAQNNVPADGKYDQSVYASPIEVPVGRVDFYNLPEFTTSEVDLLKAYFAKNHSFRTGMVPVVLGGIIDDNFGSYGEGFAAAAWRSFPLFGSDSTVKAADWFESLAGPQTYLWAYGCGGGTDVSCGGVCNTSQLATKPVHAIHTQLFGSYFGDWNTRNNLLRSALATSPSALTCGWVARPAWYTHHMALGETIGYSFRLSQNNSSNVGGQLGPYAPNVVYSAQGAGIASIGERGVHMALLGDPTLRAIMKPVPTVPSATATTQYPNKITVTWQPATDADAYMVMRSRNGNTWTTLTPQPIDSLRLIDSISNEGTLWYRVHACGLRTTASGTYYDVGAPTQTSVLTTSVSSTEAWSGVRVHILPQPATTTATLRVHTSFLLEGATVSITDMSGAVVWTSALPSTIADQTQMQLPVAELASGSYMVSVRGSGNVITTQLHVVR